MMVDVPQKMLKISFRYTRKLSRNVGRNEITTEMHLRRIFDKERIHLKGLRRRKVARSFPLQSE